MLAEKLILETDAQGRLKHIPTLPANARLEAIFLVLQENPNTQVRRTPSPKIAGQGEILGDIMTPVVAPDEWTPTP